MTTVKLTDFQLSFFNGQLKKCIEMHKKRGGDSYFCEGSSYTLDEVPSLLYTRSAACHSWVVYSFQRLGGSHAYSDYSGGGSNIKENFVVLDAGPKKFLNCSKKAHIRLLDWLVEESFAKDWVLNKDDKDSLYDNGVMLLCGKDGATCSEAMWLLKVLRHRYEGGNSIDTWSELVSRGVRPSVAFLVGSSFSGFNFSTSSVAKREVSSHVSIFFGVKDGHRLLGDGFLRDEHDRFARSTAEFYTKGESSPLNIHPLISRLPKVATDDGWGGEFVEEVSSVEALANRCLEWEEEQMKGVNR